VTAGALALSAALLFMSAVLRAAGASLVRTPRADALHDAAAGDERAALVAELLESRNRVQLALSPVLTMLVVLAVIPATWAFSRMFSGPTLFVVLVATTLLLVLVSDLAPRTIGRTRPRWFAYRFARLLALAMAVGDAANDLVSDLEEEIDQDEEAAAEAEERELISSVLEFTDTLVREVMVPRPDMVTLPATASIDEGLDVVLESGKSRIPLTGEGLDDIVGVLYARDLLRVVDDDSSRPRTCGEIARPAYFVPETKHIAELLRDMQANQVHMAIVVDEFGGTAGLVTIEDLIEEIVGEIADEYDREEPMIVPVGEGRYLIDARLDVDSLAELTGTDLPDQDWDTVGGLVLGLAGRVPKEGERFEHDGLVFVAERVQGRRIAKVRVEPRR